MDCTQYIDFNKATLFGNYYSTYVNLVLIGIPALMIGVIIGGQMAKKMSQQTFMRLSYVLLLISGVSLII